MENNEEIKKELIDKFQSLANILKSLNTMLEDKLNDYENKKITLNKNESIEEVTEDSTS